MTIDANKAVIRRFYDELWNRRAFERIGEILSPEVVFHGSLGIAKTGHAGFLDYAALVHAAFPDFHNTVETLIAEGDKVAACLTFRGTHRGEIFAIPPTGRAIEYAGVAIFVLGGGRITHCWVLGDRLALMRQLGAAAPGGADT